MTAASVRFIRDVLDDDVADEICGSLTGVDRLLERLENVLPADDRQSVRRVLEESRDRLAHDSVALVLEPLDLDDVGLDPPQLLELGQGLCQMLGDLDEHPALLESGVEPRLDLVQAEEVRGLVHVVDDVIDHLRQVVDVLAVEGSDVLRVEQLERLAGELVATGLERLDVRLPHGVLRKLGEAALDEPRGLEQVLARAREQVVERCRLGNECEPHCGGNLTTNRAARGPRRR